MKKFIYLLLAATPFVIVFSCKHDGIMPDQQVSFSHDILPIIQSSCQHSGCHDTLANETFAMIDYESVMRHGEIVAGEPNQSRLYQDITAPVNSENHMPRSPYSSLTDRNIKFIYIWIGQGAKNN